ncbi:MAG: hypothetical protein M3444_10675 [Acidobacteriota bacterium]|nr:hypothetical protein [Acidobacteriota bacterium]MDQ5839109.1 hypothetical protein [Acidobacteriota bacterium]
MLRAFSLALVFACFALSFTEGREKQGSKPGGAAGLGSLRFLLGKWAGEGGGEAGQGSGYFTFEEGLQGKVLIRKNHSEYPATKDRPAFAHDDLMIVYADAANGPRAFYTDSEGHVINYALSVSEDGQSVTFLSDPRDPGPRYRLTYVLTGPDTLALTFEASPPGQPDRFRKLIEGKVRKVPGGN